MSQWPEAFWLPPATSTWPLDSSVDVCHCRAIDAHAAVGGHGGSSVPLAVNAFVAGPEILADARGPSTSPPTGLPLPPATRMLPLDRNGAGWPPRVAPLAPAAGDG